MRYNKWKGIRNYSGFSKSVEQEQIGPNLFTWPTHKPSLIGSRCQCAGSTAFLYSVAALIAQVLAWTKLS